MKKTTAFLLTLLLTNATPSLADNVILMIGDGMGKNHIHCTHKNNPLFLKTLTPKGEIKTHSANNSVTDSAAGATAYSCGIKTNNSYLGVTPDKKPCKTLSEMSVEKGYLTLIRTTDKISGATPSAFYAHTDSRHNTNKIEQDFAVASKKMDIQSVQKIDQEMNIVLNTLKNANKPFFVVIEESEIDKQSHLNNFQHMSEALVRFDKAIEKAIEFAKEDQKTTVIVLADHETGGLTNECTYTKNNHSGENVFYFAEGQHTQLFTEPVLQNTDIHHKIKKILFQ